METKDALNDENNIPQTCTDKRQQFVERQLKKIFAQVQKIDDEPTHSHPHIHYYKRREKHAYIRFAYL